MIDINHFIRKEEMKPIINSIILYIIISLCGGAYASDSSIDLKVKGYHNKNE